MRISDWSSDVCSSDLTPVMEVGGLRVASITDRIDGPSNWTIQRDVHALILYEAGGYPWLDTWLGDMRTALGDPLPGEWWLVRAGPVLRAAATGGVDGKGAGRGRVGWYVRSYG